jgi:hypothetical protein
MNARRWIYVVVLAGAWACSGNSDGGVGPERRVSELVADGLTNGSLTLATGERRDVRIAARDQSGASVARPPPDRGRVGPGGREREFGTRGGFS